MHLLKQFPVATSTAPTDAAVYLHFALCCAGGKRHSLRQTASARLWKYILVPRCYWIFRTRSRGTQTWTAIRTLPATKRQSGESVIKSLVDSTSGSDLSAHVRRYGRGVGDLLIGPGGEAVYISSPESLPTIRPLDIPSVLGPADG